MVQWKQNFEDGIINKRPPEQELGHSRNVYETLKRFFMNDFFVDFRNFKFQSMSDKVISHLDSLLVKHADK